MPRNHVTHGMSGTRLYRCYRDMLSRCKGTAKCSKKNYHDRGITYCPEWDTFEAFRDWALSNGYRDDLTLERVDNDKGYSPDNCRWATYAEQSLNTRQNRRITFNGETKTLSEWAKTVGIKSHTIASRLDLYHWSVEEALTTRVLKGGETRCNISY